MSILPPPSSPPVAPPRTTTPASDDPTATGGWPLTASATAAGGHQPTATGGQQRTSAGRSRSTATPRRPAPMTGLTTPGVAVLLSLVTALALTVDLLVGTGLGWVFAIGFTLGCAWVAARVRRADLMAALVAPPLVFAAALLVAGEVIGGGSPGRFPVRQVLDLATSLADGAPVLVLGCGVAGAVVLVRRWRDPRP